MQFVTVLSCFVAVATAFPQDLPVVRPNHYLAQGTFKKEQHLLPESFFNSARQVETELKIASPEQQSQATQVVQQQAPAPVQKAALAVAPSSSSAESVVDSYANIGGSSGGIASALTNEYGETVPQAFSNLQEDSYAYYHGHKA